MSAEMSQLEKEILKFIIDRPGNGVPDHILFNEISAGFLPMAKALTSLTDRGLIVEAESMIFAVSNPSKHSVWVAVGRDDRGGLFILSSACDREGISTEWNHKRLVGINRVALREEYDA